MSAALTPDAAARQRSASHSRGERATPARRSQSKPPREAPPPEHKQQPSSRASSSAKNASAGASAARVSPHRANSATPKKTQSPPSLAHAHSSSLVCCVGSCDDTEVGAIAAATAAATSCVCRPLPPSPFSSAVLGHIDRIRGLLLEVKLPFIDVHLAETYLRHLARRTSATEAIDGASALDAPASTGRLCRERGGCRDVTPLPLNTLPGVELGGAGAAGSATPTRSLKAFELYKQRCHYPFRMPTLDSDGHRGGRADSAALARNPLGWRAEPTTNNDGAAAAQADRRPHAFSPCPSPLDSQGIIDEADLTHCSQTEEALSALRPHPPRPPPSGERPRPPARSGITHRSTSAESCAQHRHPIPTAFPLSLLGMLERVLVKYKAALAVALRAVMHREAVWTALQQFLHVVRSDWAPLAAPTEEVVARVPSRRHAGSEGVADVGLGSSGITGALFRLHSPREYGAGSTGDVAVGVCHARSHLSLHHAPHGASPPPSTGEGEYGAGERSSTPETQATLRTPSEQTRNPVGREATPGSSAPSLETTSAPAHSAARRGSTAKPTAQCEGVGHADVALRPPENAGDAGGVDNPRRQQRSSLRLSVDSIRQALPPSADRGAGAAAELKRASPRHAGPPPRRAAPLLLRLPNTPSSSARATIRATDGPASACARPAVALHRRTLERSEPCCSAGAGRPVHNAAGQQASALRHVPPSLSGLQQILHPQRFTGGAYGHCRRSRSAPPVSAAASQSPCPPCHPSLAVTPRAQIMPRHGVEAHGIPSRPARSVSDRGTLMTPKKEDVYRPLRASSASPAPRRHEQPGSPPATRRCGSVGATRPHSGLVPSLGVRLHAVSRQVYASCLYHYLFYLQRTTLAVVEAVDALRHHHLSHAAPFVVEHRNYLLEVLMQTSVLASDAAVKWLMREGAADSEAALKTGDTQRSSAAHLSESSSSAEMSSAAWPSAPLLDASPQGFDHASDARRRTCERPRTSSCRRDGAAPAQDAEQADQRGAQRAAQHAAARGQWPEQLLRAPLMSTHASLARYAATPHLLSQLESTTNGTDSGAREEAAPDPTPPGGGGGCQPSVPATTSPAPVTLPNLRLVLPPDVLLSYGGDGAAPEEALYHTRTTSASSLGSSAVPPASALRGRLERGERLLHCEVAAQLNYLKACMQCALKHEYLLHLRGMAEVHRRLFSDKRVTTALCDDAGKRVSSTERDREQATLMSVVSTAEHDSAGAAAACSRCDHVPLKDEICRAVWMKQLQASWQLLMSGSSSVG
ncbi:hypothetical protein LSCM1_07891 [Leishmania martiniquensis]|uniref:Uncharacterized protein n=1 Tax=Leishmania martiniquensis TaxID=1580590 RepID=A0A836H072_9TRYP|nr:hypothetical protein LSCM1_07891 [Leishmania martiniquensis]